MSQEDYEERVRKDRVNMEDTVNVRVRTVLFNSFAVLLPSVSFQQVTTRLEIEERMIRARVEQPGKAIELFYQLTEDEMFLLAAPYTRNRLLFLEILDNFTARFKRGLVNGQLPDCPDGLPELPPTLVENSITMMNREHLERLTMTTLENMLRLGAASHCTEDVLLSDVAWMAVLIKAMIKGNIRPEFLPKAIEDILDTRFGQIKNVVAERSSPRVSQILDEYAPTIKVVGW